MSDPAPRLSVIVTPVGGVGFIRRHLAALVPQIVDQPIEVIVPYDATAAEMASLGPEFPAVRFVEMGIVETDAAPGTRAAAHEIYDRRTAAGMRAARGSVLALMQDYGVPGHGWAREVLEAHRLPHGAIGGAVEHAGGGALNWAVYFLDFGRHGLPIPEGPVRYLTDVNVSYKREVLATIRSTWEVRYKEVVVNWRLAANGETLWQRPQIVVWQDRGRLNFLELVIERYCWGRLFGAMRVAGASWRRRLALTLASPAIPVVLIARRARKVIADRRHVGEFLRCLPVLVGLTLCWCAGEAMGYLTGRESVR